MQRSTLLWSFAGLVAATVASIASPAHAQRGSSEVTRGTVTTNIIVPTQIEAIETLRFGSMQAPAANGTVQVTPIGAITSSFDLTAFPSTRGPARFWVRGDPNRMFLTFTPNSATLTNGRGNVMTVNAFTMNAIRGNLNRFDRSGRFDLFIGGTLNVAALQPAGSYAGSFEVTVLYL